MNEKCGGHGKCESSGRDGFACVCHDGWSGKSCETEYSSSNGGWIAGIVVLAVLVVIAAGVALFFAKKWVYFKNTSKSIREFWLNRIVKVSQYEYKWLQSFK